MLDHLVPVAAFQFQIDSGLKMIFENSVYSCCSDDRKP